jgi:hypothetical protein
VTSARYLEIDVDWWGDTAHGAPEPEPLFDALAADGWKIAEGGRRRRLFVREFDSDGEYRSALARARFAVAAHLVPQHCRR